MRLLIALFIFLPSFAMALPFSPNCIQREPFDGELRRAINKLVIDKKDGQRGMASWYGPGFHGKKTASGEKFNQNAMTAAHPTLPFGTKVLVTNQETKRSICVTINDRGPYAHGRIIDLSKGAAAKIGLKGTAKVHLSRCATNVASST